MKNPTANTLSLSPVAGVPTTDALQLSGTIVPPTPPALELIFDSIENAPVVDPASVSQWNTFFDLPTNGTPFTSVSVVSNRVYLYGGSGITIAPQLFQSNQNILRFIDNVGCIIEVGLEGFDDCLLINGFKAPSLVTIRESGLRSLGEDSGVLNELEFPSLIEAEATAMAGMKSVVSISCPLMTTAGSACFLNNNALKIVRFPSLVVVENNLFSTSLLTEIGINSCTNLGATVGDDGVFAAIAGQIITLTVPAALMTCNLGQPDGDIQFLIANNTVTVIEV